MLHRTELQTIQKTVKSLTPSKPVCPTRAYPETSEPVQAKGTVEMMVKATAQVNSRHLSRRQNTVTHPGLGFNCSKPRPYKDLQPLCRLLLLFLFLPLPPPCPPPPPPPPSQGAPTKQSILSISLPFRERKSSYSQFPSSLPSCLPSGNWEDKTAQSHSNTPRFK